MENMGGMEEAAGVEGGIPSAALEEKAGDEK
jgi:hypothetical protein